MGRIYWREGVAWADYCDPHGRRRRHSLRTSDARVARERLRKAELASTDPATHREARSLSDAILYMITVAASSNAEGTRRFYRVKCCHALRLLGDVDVAEIAKSDVLTFANQRLHEGAHQDTVGKELIALRRVLLAEHDRVPLPTPPRDVIPKWKMLGKARDRWLEPGEFRRVMAKTPAPRRLWMMVAVYTGACRGELEGLRWEDVDWKRGAIHVRGTKRDTRDRRVPIHPALRPWIDAGKGRRGVMFARWGNVCRDLAVYAEHARIPVFTPNDLRRTFGSWLAQAGVPLFTIAKLMGHSSTKMVEKHYGHLSPTTFGNAVATMPDCDAGVPPVAAPMTRGGTFGAERIADNRAKSKENRVPKDGVEPPTRGFSVPASSPRKASR